MSNDMHEQGWVWLCLELVSRVHEALGPSLTLGKYYEQSRAEHCEARRRAIVLCGTWTLCPQPWQTHLPGFKVGVTWRPVQLQLMDRSLWITQGHCLHPCLHGGLGENTSLRMQGGQLWPSSQGIETGCSLAAESYNPGFRCRVLSSEINWSNSTVCDESQLHDSFPGTGQLWEEDRAAEGSCLPPDCSSHTLPAPS